MMRHRTSRALIIAATIVGISITMTPWAAPPSQDAPEPASRREATLVHAQRFELEQSYTHWWRRERPQVDSGWLLVIEADRTLLQVKQLAMPILQVGAEIAERVNRGDDSGRVVVVVPGDFLLADTPIFFAEPGLPEQQGQTEIEQAVDSALARGVQPVTIDEVDAVIQDTLRLPSQRELYQAAIDLVEIHSPQEHDLIRGARVRRVR